MKWYIGIFIRGILYLMQENRFRDICGYFGQEGFIRIYDSLPFEARERILRQADMLDFTMLKGIEAKRLGASRGRITPITTMTMDESDKKREVFTATGLEALRRGTVGVVLLAGGMGTRLGFDHAKGMCDIGETREVFIFQRAIENLTDTVRACGRPIYLFIMTSYINDAETRRFFKDHDWFGYDPDYISFFVQDMAPCLDDDYNMFLERPDALAASPNGNGGFYSSMMNCGLDVKARERGIEYLDVVAVDNVLQRIADPMFVGAVIEGGYDTGAKVVRKADPDEKVGAICLEDGAPSVVEYYEMTDELKAEKNEHGCPAYDYGVILNYLFRMDAIDKVVRNDLPIHVVRKKVPYLDEEGRTAAPDRPNAYKLETLTLDLVHLVGSCLPFEVDRSVEFAPVKNATGTDSVESARRMLKAAGYQL